MVTFCLAKLNFSQIVTFLEYEKEYIDTNCLAKWSFFCLSELNFPQMLTFCSIFAWQKLKFPQIVTLWEHKIVKHKRESTLIQIALPNYIFPKW